MKSGKGTGYVPKNNAKWKKGMRERWSNHYHLPTSSGKKAQLASTTINKSLHRMVIIINLCSSRMQISRSTKSYKIINYMPHIHNGRNSLYFMNSDAKLDFSKNIPTKEFVLINIKI